MLETLETVLNMGNSKYRLHEDKAVVSILFFLYIDKRISSSITCSPYGSVQQCGIPQTVCFEGIQW